MLCRFIRLFWLFGFFYSPPPQLFELFAGLQLQLRREACTLYGLHHFIEAGTLHETQRIHTVRFGTYHLVKRLCCLFLIACI